MTLGSRRLFCALRVSTLDTGILRKLRFCDGKAGTPNYSRTVSSGAERSKIDYGGGTFFWINLESRSLLRGVTPDEEIRPYVGS